MKMSILILSIFFFALQLSAQEPQVKFYLSDGTFKIYKIADIENIRVIDKKNNYVMRIHYQDTLVAKHILSNIDTLKFELNSKSNIIFSVYINSLPSSYVLTDIDSIIFETPVINPPHITSIVPDTVMIGDEITITGSYFANEQGSGFVIFGNTNAVAYNSWSDTELKVRILQGAKSGKVSVTVNGRKSNEVDVFIDTTKVLIGNQVWMTRNLDVSHYRNGDSIPQVTDSTLWKNLTTGAWCYYNNDTTMGAIYGKLYNWFAINDPRGLAPTGWQVPLDKTWTLLTTYIKEDGGKLKEIGTDHWKDPNKGATNESGFTALPCGYRDKYGHYYGLGIYCTWWSSTERDVLYAWVRTLFFNSINIESTFYPAGMAYPVRCIKD